MDELKAQLEVWKTAQFAYVESREAYRKPWGAAYLASDAKTGDQKKAAADVVISGERLLRDTNETIAAAEWQLLLALRGKLESSQQPGQHFGEAA
jgi:hypothetical protein